ncbi:hypothetical protein [Caulobacter flavus]|uniref:hypothetical protein n=1 Tax=Caulobacter flavus TaxID=1679497 RepID=UPI0015DF6619|nr:hypothetical protein [Caulobacter flavus]
MFCHQLGEGGGKDLSPCAYTEARGRGEAWRKLLDEAVGLLPEDARKTLEGL